MSGKLATLLSFSGSEDIEPFPFFYPEGDDENWEYVADCEEPERKETPKFLLLRGGLHHFEHWSLHAHYGEKEEHPDVIWLDETYHVSNGKVGIPCIKNFRDFPENFIRRHLNILLLLCNFRVVQLDEEINPYLYDLLITLLSAERKFVSTSDDMLGSPLSSKIQYFLEHPGVKPVTNDLLLLEKVDTRVKTGLVIPDEQFPPELLRSHPEDRILVLTSFPREKIQQLLSWVLDSGESVQNCCSGIALVSYSERLLGYNTCNVLHAGEEKMVRDMEEFGDNDYFYLDDVGNLWYGENEEKMGDEGGLTGILITLDNIREVQFRREDKPALVFYAKYLFRDFALAQAIANA